MTMIRRIAHQPREAQCTARLLLMQVILVCVVRAAQKAWTKGRTADGDPDGDVMHEKIPVSEAGKINAFEEDPADSPCIPIRSLRASFTGRGEFRYGICGRSCFPGRLRQPGSSGRPLTAGY
jgi:hypothetical protein